MRDDANHIWLIHLVLNSEERDFEGIVFCVRCRILGLPFVVIGPCIGFHSSSFQVSYLVLWFMG